jgi:hypothetical protein
MTASDQGTSAPSDRGRSITAGLPIEETDQPDLMLELSTAGRPGAGRLVLTAVVIAVIVGIVFYALLR